MKIAVTAIIASLVGSAVAQREDGKGHEDGTFAVLRFIGKELTKGRADPIVFPGKVSSHVHHVMGGSAFGLSSTGEDLTKSECSNALVKGDNSNYWFPSLYFKDPKNGTLEPVELFYANAYYFFEKTHDDIKAFPLGLSIVSGDATTRTVPAAGPGQHLDPSKGPVNSARWCCSRLNNDYDPPNWHPDSDGSMSGMGDPNDLGMGVGFPDQDCDGYASPLRADIHFPSCYNPKAGLTNYKENMAFPSDSNSYLDCPKGWIHVPHLFMEVYWNTLVFEGRWEPGKGDQPFVLSSGDATGYSSHADFMSGWDTELLQHIIDTCNTGTKGMDHCPGLFYGLNEGECTIPSPVDENVDGVLDALPGNNPITGWKYGAGGKISTSNAGSDSGSGSNSGSDSESSSSSSYEDSDSTLPAATPSASQQYVDDASESSTTSSLVSTESQTAKVVAVSLEAKGVSANVTGPASRYSPSKPTELPSTLAYGHTRPFCSPKTHTVWETVTVTASEVAAQSTETNLRRHVHGHARRKFGHHH